MWTKQNAEHQTEQQRKLEMLKTLVFDYRMNLFYQFVDQISTNAEKLIKCSNKSERKTINEELLADFYSIRLKFLETLKIVDSDVCAYWIIYRIHFQKLLPMRKSIFLKNLYLEKKLRCRFTTRM